MPVAELFSVRHYHTPAVSTHCALHVHSADQAALLTSLRAFLREEHGRGGLTSERPTLGEFYGREFDAHASRPTAFLVGSEQPGWQTAHFNSFEHLDALARSLSAKLAAVVACYQMQSVSEAHRLSVHRGGEHLRTLEFAEGEWLLQEGQPLPFETVPLGTNVAEPGEEPHHEFGRDEAADYVMHFGLTLWGEQEPSRWTHLGVTPAPIPVPAPPRRRWWQGWLRR